MKLGWVTLGAALFAAPMAGFAQRTTSRLDLGTARMRYADSIDASALSASFSLRHRTSRATFDGSGTMSRLQGAWSNSGTAGASIGNAISRWLTAELATTAGGSLHSDGARTGQVLAGVRLRVESPSRGMWVGGGAGQAWDGIWRATRQGEAGAWLAAGSSTAIVSITPTSVGDSIEYSDASFWLNRSAERWEADASLSVRIGSPIPSLPSNRKVWGGVSATRWMSQSVGIQAAVGTYPVDFTQGFPGGQYMSLSLRFAPRRSSTVDVSLAGRSTTVEPKVREFRTAPTGGDTYRIRVFAPRAGSVEIAGDFTLWSARSLTRGQNGWFETIVSIASGTHQVHVRVDSGGWEVPPGLAPLLDEFGGAVGLLTVP